MKDTFSTVLIIGATLAAVKCGKQYCDQRIEDGVRREREALDAMHKKAVEDAWHQGYAEGYEAGRKQLTTPTFR